MSYQESDFLDNTLFDFSDNLTVDIEMNFDNIVGGDIDDDEIKFITIEENENENENDEVKYISLSQELVDNRRHNIDIDKMMKFGLMSEEYYDDIIDGGAPDTFRKDMLDMLSTIYLKE